MEGDKEKEQLLLCKDVRDRFEMWCASFNVVDKAFDRGLRKSMGIAGVVFRLFDRIRVLLYASTQTLLSFRSIVDKYNRVGQHLFQLRHLVEKLIELSPAIEAPAFSTASQIENGTRGYTLADFDLARDPLSQSITGRFEGLRAYKTLFLISNSVALQGWRWDMAAQLVYQSARRIPPAARDMAESPEVTYSSGKALRLLIVTADGLGPKVRTMERAILEIGKKMKIVSAAKGQVIIRFVQLGANPFITQDVKWLGAAINSDEAILGIIEIQLLVIEGVIASELMYEQLLLGGDRGLIPPSIRSLDSKGLTIPCCLVVDNLTVYTDIEILHVCFEVYGPLDDVRIHSTTNATVFAALITYRSTMDAEVACAAFDNTRQVILPLADILSFLLKFRVQDLMARLFASIWRLWIDLQPTSSSAKTAP
ncbi:MAG: hypothetical protein ALECFALPRED_009213 [Alectoria fallacina]|uniref:Uncharacterized protein n=1 Tax=Alectoria fallacina TaxID=1903189 RepID=A0A8H3ID38_9LECA|nr:MAG: hypothetical protein ALECFALPRED_009213 [Alectoria fallacina]